MEPLSKTTTDVSSYLDIAVSSLSMSAPGETIKHQTLGVHPFNMEGHGHIKADGARSMGSTSPPSLRSAQVVRSDGATKSDGETGKSVTSMKCANGGSSTAAVARVQEQALAALTGTSNPNGARSPIDRGIENGISTFGDTKTERAASGSGTATAIDSKADTSVYSFISQPQAISATATLEVGDIGPSTNGYLKGNDTPPGNQRDSSSSKSGKKTPSFPNEADDSPSKSRRNRRRADTPHPVSGNVDSNTTTPQTTPEKPSKPSRKRKPRRTNGERAAPGSVTSDMNVGADSPLARKSTRKPRRKKVAGQGAEPGVVVSQTQSDAVVKSVAEEGSLEPESVVPEVKMSTSVHALSVEIEYPSFQTTAILEFEPDFPQLQPVQPSETGVESETTQLDGTEAKPKVKNGGLSRRRRFRRRIPIIKKQKPKRPVKEGTHPMLVDLFTRYGIEFCAEKRPYLQYFALESAALQNDPLIDVTSLREEFRKTYQRDSNYAWTADEFKASSIDDYFAKSEKNVSTFRYVPTAEATEEFIRLGLEAGWIKERPPQWDVTHWDASLERYEKLWEGREAKKQRRRFRNACFWEFDQYLGRIFFDIQDLLDSDEEDESEGEDSLKTASHEADLKQRLEDCRCFLSHFGDFASASLEDCQEFIDHKLNVNLYDLLNWLRNPDTVVKPQRFASVRDLGIYSYQENKVFPRFRASESYIASPLLRSIGFFARPRKDLTTEYDRKEKSAASGQSGNAAFTDESPKGMEDVVSGETSSTTVESESMQGTGTSLFKLSDSSEQNPSKKTTRFGRKRRGAISNRHPPKGITTPGAGDAVTVAA